MPSKISTDTVFEKNTRVALVFKYFDSSTAFNFVSIMDGLPLD